MKGPLAARSRWVRIGHILFWTALFYLLAVGVAKVCEWLAAG